MSASGSIGRIWEKFYNAVRALSGFGSPAERMTAAAAEIGQLLPVDGMSALPLFAGRYSVLMARLMDGADDPIRGAPHATARSMDEATFMDVAAEILSLYDAVTRYMPHAEE